MAPLVFGEVKVKKVVKIVVIVLVAAFVVLQFFQIDRSAPPVVEADTLEATTNVPPDIALIMGRSCNDCHTNVTRYPWYSYIQPSGWFLKNHIDDGRRHLNFSIWNTYAAKKKAQKLDQMCEQLDLKAMPLPSYLWIHRDAVLSDTDSKALCDWARAESAKITQ